MPKAHFYASIPGVDTRNSFEEKLTAAIEQRQSLLCIGLDPDPFTYPAHFSGIDSDPGQALLDWGRAIIDRTAELACCYKPNFAFYEQYGPAGLEALRRTIAAVPAGTPVLLDAKRGDIGSTAAAYARAAFEIWRADAVTVNPYLGRDGVAPFLAFPGKAVFVLGYTSNPSAHDIQEFGSAGQGVLFEHIARLGQQWGGPDQVAFVVGATQPQALARFRALAPDRWFLAPGIGAQGGHLDEALAAGLDAGGSGLIVPVSRHVIYAADPHAAARQLREAIEQARAARSAAGPVTAAPPEPEHRELILQLHQVGCVQFGDFTLASGRQSPIYIDLRRLSASPELLRTAARAYARLLQPLAYDRLAAVPYAALPIGTATALAANKPLIYPRKEIKTHGTGQAIEGAFEAGETVVVIEDLVTSGGSVLRAIEPLAAAGLRVKDVVVLIDREQGGSQNLAQAGYRLHAVTRLSEVLKVLHQAFRISPAEFDRTMNYLAG